MKRLLNLGLLLLVIQLLLISLTACSSSDSLASTFSKEKVSEKSKIIVELLNDKNYEKVVDNFSTDLKAQLNADLLKTNLDPVLVKAGNFNEFKSETIVGKKLEDKSDYAVEVIVCSYENTNLTYTISFDENMDLIGLYVK